MRWRPSIWGKWDLAEGLVLGIQSGEGSERFPGTHRLLGLIHARQGNFPLAATAYRDFLAAQPLGPVAKDLRPPTHRMGSPGSDPEGENGSLDDPGIPARSRRPFVNSERFGHPPTGFIQGRAF